MTNIDSVLKCRHCSANKGLYSQGHGLPSGHVWLWQLDHKDGRTPKNWCLRTVALEKTPESPLDSKEIKSVYLKGDQPEYSLEGLMLKRQYFGYLMHRQLIEKAHDSWKDQGQKEKRVSVNELAGQHHWHNGNEFGQTLGDGEGQGSLACCSPQGHKKSDMTGQLNNNNISSWWNLDFASLAWTIQMSCFPKGIYNWSHQIQHK